MKSATFPTPWLPLILVVGLACQSREHGDASRREGAADSAEPKSAIVAVEPIDLAGLRALLQERNGKILLLNVWATWCVPCVEEFPDLVKLSEVYEKRDVEVVGISVDYPDEVESKVIPFLKKQVVPFRVYVANVDRQEEFINALSRSWSGALPATFIYDRGGIQRFSLIGKGSFERFQQEIDKLKGAQ